MYEIATEKNFSAAHHLRNYNGPCENVHGHNWHIRVVVRCETLNEIGIGIDFKEIKQKLTTVLDLLDHIDLNTVFKEHNPSSENIAYYIYTALSTTLATDRVWVYRVDVYETPGNCASYISDKNSI